MLDILTYMIAGVSAVGLALLLYLLKQIYSSNSPYTNNEKQ